MAIKETEKRMDTLAKIIWDYHLLHHKLEKADCIFVLGSHDPNVAEYGIDLFFEGWADYLIFSGGIIHPKDILKNEAPKTEAEAFYDIAIARGVSKEKIIVENRSKNTGENFQFTADILTSLNHKFKKFIVVQKPYMERRTYATGMIHWKDKNLIITSTKTTYEEYLKSGIPKDRFINTMVGDLQRIKIYPAKGFQIQQEIPSNVWAAYEELVKLGFDKRLAEEE
ncbi:MAG: YdcF family protein [Ignavibacteriaceae bacterium]|jgi:uncharacterized SAM-binding protein YcdF (DUF218 family)